MKKLILTTLILCATAFAQASQSNEQLQSLEHTIMATTNLIESTSDLQFANQMTFKLKGLMETRAQLVRNNQVQAELDQIDAELAKEDLTYQTNCGSNYDKNFLFRALKIQKLMNEKSGELYRSMSTAKQSDLAFMRIKAAEIQSDYVKCDAQITAYLISRQR